MRERTKDRVLGFMSIGLIVVFLLVLKFYGPQRMPVGPLDVSVVDTNYQTLPYVRVEIENLQKGYKSEAQNFGRYFDGPFWEGKHRVVVKLGNHSGEMTELVYDRVHDFTKDMKTLGITLNNVRQRFDIEIAKQEVKIPETQYAERKDIFLRPYEDGQWTQRKNISAPFELKILDDIENIFRANIYTFLAGFRYVTFIRQEYPEGKWVYHVRFTHSHPEPHERTGSGYNFFFSTPNIGFSVSQDMAVFNRVYYSSQFLNIHGFTIVQTTFASKDFLPK